MARAAGHEINYLAMSGLLHQIGTADGTPVLPLNVVGDFGGGGLLMAFGILCAYIESQRSGRGQVVDAAMVDGATSFLSMALGQLASGLWRDAPGVNWLSGRAHCYGTYRTRDGRWIAVGALEPQFHRIFVERLGLDYAEFQAGEFGMDGARYDELVEEIWPRLKPRVAAAIAARTQAEVLALFEGTDACVTPVLSIAEAQRHAQIVERGTYVSVDGQLQNAPAPRFSRTQPADPIPAPEVGEHTAEILAALGYSVAEVESLVRERVAFARMA
jgi:alpha-methylacyl-CoA racemase